MDNNIESWWADNQEIVRKMTEWRKGYVCNNNCWEWKKWGFCSHLRKARAKKFGSEIRMQVENLMEINSKSIPLEPSQSLTIA